MFFEIFIQMMPYLAVFAVLGYIGRAQQKKAKEREEEQKKGIIRTCYVVKTEKILTIIFIIGIFFTGGLVVASVIQQEDFFPLFVFGIAFVVFLIGSLNLDDWTIARLLGHKSLKNVKYYRKMSNQILANDTRKARNRLSQMVLECLDGWEEEYEQIRYDDSL